MQTSDMFYILHLNITSGERDWELSASLFESTYDLIPFYPSINEP